MTRHIAALLIAVGLMASCVYAGNPSSTFVLRSDLGVCTAWPVKAHKELRWVAVEHCTGIEPERSSLVFSIDGIPATLEKIDSGLALFKGGPDVIPFKLANAMPELGEDVFILSRPYGGPQIFVRGYFSAPNIPIGDLHFSLFQVPTAPGSSGSPVFDLDNRVIGVATSIPCEVEQGFCPMTLAIALDALKKFVQ
jgi:hypothetical protein